MAYYAIAFSLTLILSARMTAVKREGGGDLTRPFRRTGAVLMALLPLIFLALFRWNVGADSVYGSSYWMAYHDAAQGVNRRGVEMGFYWFMRVFAALDIPYFWFLFAHGVLFYAFIACALRRGSVQGVFSVALFFLLTVYFDAYSSLRQSLAEAICLLGWAKMGAERNGLKKDIPIVSLFLLSSLFHSTGLINIPVYLLCRLRFRRRADVLILAAAAVGMTPIWQRVIPVIMDTLSSNDGYTTLGLARINIAVSGLFFALTWLFYDEIDRRSPNGYMYVNQALVIFVMILNSGAMYLPYRVYDMLKIGYIFILPQAAASISGRRNRIVVYWIFAGVCAAAFVNFALQPNNIYMDYQSAFSDWRSIIRLP